MGLNMSQTWWQRIVKRLRHLRYYQISIVIWLIVFSIYVGLGNPVPTQNYRPDNWASMSIEVGAAVLTLVAIITAIVLSSENAKRTEFTDNLNEVLNKMDEKKRLNPDRSFYALYDASKQRIQTVIDSVPALRYAESMIGIFAFYCFLASSLFAILGIDFKHTLIFFLYGIGLLIGYVFYVIDEFKNTDKLSHADKKEGTLTLLAHKINGVPLPLDVKEQKANLDVNRGIERIEFKLKFEGKLRNGFLHATVKYKNGLESFIPDANTYLANFGFANDYALVILERQFDTGLLQTKGTQDFDFELVLRNEKGSDLNPLVATAFIERLGEQQIYRHCSIPDNNSIIEIGLRMYEDPFYKPNYKRREVACVTIDVSEPSVKH
jgi:hypothetical protein